MLEEMKKQVVRYAQQADRSGLCKHRSGNFSIRDQATGLICITPAGMDREQLTYHDIVVLNASAEVVEAETHLRPTSETLMHLRAYQTRPDIHAVAHTHSKAATAFAILQKPIPAVVYEIANLGCKEGFVPVAAYARPGTAALADSVVQPLQIADAILLASHGVMAVAADLKEALLKADYVEELAEIYYRTLQLNGGKEPPVLPAQELVKWAYPKEIKLPVK